MSRMAWISLTTIVVCTLAAVVILVAPLVYNQPVPSSSRINFLHGNVTVGSATDQPGFSRLIIGTNHTEGFDADFIRWLGEDSPQKWNPRLVPTAVDQRVPALKNRSLQLVIQTFSITDERLKDIDMAGPYLVNYQGVMVRSGDSSFPTPDSLRSRDVCAPKGSTSEIELEKRGVFVTTEPGISGCVARLRARQVDAVSTDQLLLYGYAQLDSSLYVVPENTFGLREEYGVGLPYGSYDECLQITESIKRFVNSPAWHDYLRISFGDFDRTSYRPTGTNECVKRT